jgi:uncharacterized protein YjiS (DUF1127 family)
MTVEIDMATINEFDRTILVDDLSRPWHQQRLIRDELVRQARAHQAAALRTALRSQLTRLWRVATFATDAVRLVAGCGAAALRRWWQKQAEQAERRRAMAELAGMSDRELWDIGLRRSEIYWATRYGRIDRAKRAVGKSAAPSLTAKPARSDATSGCADIVADRKRAA